MPGYRDSLRRCSDAGSSSDSTRPRLGSASGGAVFTGRDDTFRLPWIWTEGWRARLRQGGDQVEAARWEWLLDRRRHAGRNSVSSIVLSGKVPGASALKGGEGGDPEFWRARRGNGGKGSWPRAKRKSVHWGPDEEFLVF
ncbi:hypothetical protein RB595_006297 [Gaeumannomyces hyphopodioides]